MPQPLWAESLAEVAFYSLAFLSGLTGVIAMVSLLAGFFQYYLSSGDEEKMRQAGITIGKALIIFFVSLFLGAIAFYLGKNNFYLE